MRTRPLVITKMMIAPIMARQTVPRPPATEAPPMMTAVSAWNSQPTPVVEFGAALARGVENASGGA